jgi:hypothetical protein
MGTYLQRANSSPSSQKKFTVSTWVKVCREGGDKYMWSIRTDDSNWIGCRFAVNGCIILQVYTSGSTTGQLQTNAFFRDFSAWYHVVVAVDTTQSTAGDRLKLYVNGSQETSFSTTTNPSLNADIPIASNFQVATSPYSSQYNSNSLDGYLAQFIYADNQAYSPSTFGSTNANGIWIPNSQPSVTYGTNGFKLDFAGTGASADASGFGADSSGNNNHFASSNLGTNPSTTDQCINNFATMNPNIATQGQTPTYSKGNTFVTSTSSGSYGASALSTFAIDSGKWYWETKITGDRNNGIAIGLADATWAVGSATDSWFGNTNLNGYAFQFTNGGQKKVDNGTGTSYGTQIAVNDILGTAYDADNNTITWYINGSSQGQAFSSMRDITFVPASYGYYNTQWEFNFGNPAFTIASGNSDANGYGNFEYAVPSGYYALCSKNLGAYGG